MTDRESGLDDFIAVPGDATLDKDFVAGLLFIEVIQDKGLLGDCYEHAYWLKTFLKFDFV